MLNLMRKYSRSWVTIALFGGIIIVFVFFFGYTDLDAPPIGGRATVATVNGIPVTTGELAYYTAMNKDYYKKIFQDQTPPNFDEILRQQSLQQVIQQKLLANYARRTGLLVSDEELAAFVRSIGAPDKDTGFDPIWYQQQFLPGFHQEYQVHFEDLMRERLLANQARLMVQKTARVSATEARAQFERDETRFTFEVTTIDPAALVAAKKLETPEAAEALAERLHAAFGDAAQRRRVLQEFDLTVDEVGPSPASPLPQVLGPEAKEKQWLQLYALTPEQPQCPAAFHVGTKYVVCRLKQLTRPTSEEWDAQQETYLAQAQSRRESQRLQRFVQEIAGEADVYIIPDPAAGN